VRGRRELIVTFIIISLQIVFGFGEEFGRVAQNCVIPTGLKFCTDVNYPTSVANPTKRDTDVKKFFDDTYRQQIQTQDCYDMYKSYMCAFNFPKCPYCDDHNGICRTGCIDLTVSCGHEVQDALQACFGGDLFVDDNGNISKYGCTPMLDLVNYTCIEPDSKYAPFCQPDYNVVSASGKLTDAQAVWKAMDSVTKIRYDSFASAPVTQECKTKLKSLLCSMYFSPCDPDGKKYLNPRTDVLPILCASLLEDCPSGFAKLCYFADYEPPNPNLCK